MNSGDRFSIAFFVIVGSSSTGVTHCVSVVMVTSGFVAPVITQFRHACFTVHVNPSVFVPFLVANIMTKQLKLCCNYATFDSQLK